MNPKTAPRAATIVLLILILTLATTIASASAPASAAYPQFHHNPQRTGNVSGDSPLTDTLLWKTSPSAGNFYSMNTRVILTEEAWATGKDMADALIERYRADHSSEYPRKLTFVLWAWAMTDQGVVESGILCLVGAKPVWDEYGNVCDVQLIDESELGRPRIDVMVVPSGLCRDVFPENLKLIDRAIRLAAAANDTMHGNYVMENSEKIFEALNTTGNYAEEDAAYLSASRIFLKAPGTYGPNLDSVVSVSDTWNNSSVIGEMFIARMHYIYGNEVWGIPGEEVFMLNLAQIDMIVYNTNSNLYGFIDNDGVFQYVGGLASAYRYIIGGGGPDVYVTDNRDPDENPTVSSLSEMICRELRTRYLNPKWIEGMMGEGYAGAREISKFAENLWGWEATMPDLITDSMWQNVYDVYVVDECGLGIGEFASEHNPYAYQSMTARMLETTRKGNWNPSDEVMVRLVTVYIGSIVETGHMACCHHCGNSLLDEYVHGLISTLGITIDQDVMDAYERIMRGVLSDGGAITTADAVLAIHMAAGSIPALDWADVSGDGMVTSLDALMILQNTIGG